MNSELQAPPGTDLQQFLSITRLGSVLTLEIGRLTQGPEEFNIQEYKAEPATRDFILTQEIMDSEIRDIACRGISTHSFIS